MNANPHTEWLDRGWWVHPDGQRRLLSWNAGTHELAFHSLHRFDRPIILAVIDTETEVIRRLDGWEAHNDQPGGLGWLAGRLEGCR